MSNGSPPPFGTIRRYDRGTYGPTVEALHYLLTGRRLLPWQRLVLDVALEHDDVGRLVYDTVALVVPRQQGKTTLLEALMTWSSRRGTDRTVVYAAQDRQMARDRLLDEYELKRLARSRFAGRYRSRRSNGSESIRWLDRPGSKLTVVANTDTAGHGLTTDTAIIDEAFSHSDMTVVNALQPTMVTRPDPQLWVVSTPGDGSDGLLQHYEEIGEASLGDPDTPVAFFRWAAGEGDDRADPAVWARVMPALGSTADVAAGRRTITVDRIRSYLHTTPPAEFDRAYLCRRPGVADLAKLDPVAWADCAVDAVDLAGPVTVAVAVALDRSHTTIAAAGWTPAGRLGVVVDRRGGTDWAGAELARLADLYRPDAVYGDRRAGAGSILADAAAHGAPVVELGAGDVADACAAFYDAVAGRVLAHEHQPDLDVAAARAVERPLGDAWAWSMRRSTADISPIVAATWAVGRHRIAYPPAETPGRIY